MQVVVENLTKVYDREAGSPILALDGVSLSVDDGELLVIVGPSGCGKTTLLRLIAGLEGPTAGTVKLDRQFLKGVPPAKGEVAMVFQSGALYPHLTAYENIAFGLVV